MSRWCILRANGASTLRLASSLCEAGIEAWTPECTITKRAGRSRARKDARAPIMPTFVFVRAEHVADLQRIRTLPASPHPRFSIFRYLNRIPLIDDRDIASLRGEEERAKHAELKRIRRIVPVGSEVTVTEGAFAGMTGIVEQSNGKSALVSFGGSFTVSIAAWLLPDNRVEDGASIKDMAA